jgi:hypothetical protein
MAEALDFCAWLCQLMPEAVAVPGRVLVAPELLELLSVPPFRRLASSEEPPPP